MTLQNKLQQIGQTLAGVTQKTYHYFRPVKDAPCLIWYETGEDNSFNADNHKAEQRITGTVDCFTKTEFDPLLDEVQTALDSLGLTWSLDSVQYEDETNLIHYSWNWGVINGEDEVEGA